MSTEAGFDCLLKRSTQSMDQLESLEIYIPVEAEVKNIRLCSLPKSMLRRMGLPLCDTDARKLAESPEGIWICPAVLRKKGQKPTSHTGNSMTENMSSLMGKELRAAQAPFRMSFVSSSRTAYKVLQETMPKRTVSSQPSPSSQLPQGAAPENYKDAVVIYSGRIYLSIRKPSRSKSQRQMPEPQPASQSVVHSTSSKSQRKRQHAQASVKPADKAIKRTKLNSSLPQMSTNRPKVLLKKTGSRPVADQEQHRDKSPQLKHTNRKVAHSEIRMDVTLKGRDVPSSKTARSVPQSADSARNGHCHRHEDARGEEAAEEATSHEPARFQPQREQQQQEEEEEEEVANNDRESQDLCSEAAERGGRQNDTDSNVTTVSREPDNPDQSWSRRTSQGAALQQEYDELAQEEEIALLKAKLRQTEAAISCLHSS